MIDVPYDVNLLLVEDEHALAEVLIELLGGMGFHVCYCDRADRAIEHMQKKAFDVILSDIRLPGSLSGWDVAKAAPKDPSVTIVIFMTAYSELDDAEKARTLGVYDFLTKPFNPVELSARISNAVRYQSVLRQMKGTPVAAEPPIVASGNSKESNERIKVRLDQKIAEQVYHELEQKKKASG